LNIINAALAVRPQLPEGSWGRLEKVQAN